MRKSPKGINLKPFLGFMGIILIPITLLMIYHVVNPSGRLIPLSIIALIAGVILESKLLSEKWSVVLNIFLLSFLLSFMSFMPGENEEPYDLDFHIMEWTYYFLFFVIIITASFNKEKVIPRLSEGVTLIMSMAFIYWIIDHNFLSTSSFLILMFMYTGILIAVFAIINAFLSIPLTKSFRLFLSIWSSMIMVVFAIDNIYEIYRSGQIEDSVFFLDKLIIGLKYFFLGVSSIYIAQNIIMIVGYLPSRYRFFNDEYFLDIKKISNDHVRRYSEKQSDFNLSLLILMVITAFFSLNYIYHFLPANTAVWVVFFLFNRMVYFYNTHKVNYPA